MTAAGLVYPVLTAVAGFVAFMSLPLLGFSLLHMIGKTNV